MLLGIDGTLTLVAMYVPLELRSYDIELSIEISMFRSLLILIVRSLYA